MIEGKEIMTRQQEIIADLRHWFRHGPISTLLLTAPPVAAKGEGDQFAGILIYAKTVNSHHWTKKMALAAADWQFERAEIGDPMPFSAQPSGWDKAILVAKVSREEGIEQALNLMGLTESEK
jgi:hypothetical protein